MRNSVKVFGVGRVVERKWENKEILDIGVKAAEIDIFRVIFVVFWVVFVF